MPHSRPSLHPTPPGGSALFRQACRPSRGCFALHPSTSEANCLPSAVVPDWSAPGGILSARCEGLLLPPS
eukprot:14417758-Alexandrium_andersonii.AAC.1